MTAVNSAKDDQDFRAVTLGAIPRGAQISVMSDERSVFENPNWISAAAQIGALNALNGWNERPTRATLSWCENPVVAALVKTLVTRRNKSDAPWPEADPVNGDPLPDGASGPSPVTWWPLMKPAFEWAANKVLSEISPTDLASPPPAVRANLGLLLAAASVAGEVNVASLIAQACPRAMSTPISDRLFEIIPSGEMYTPAYLAMKFDKPAVLQAFVDGGLDVMAPMHWKLHDNASGSVLHDQRAMLDPAHDVQQPTAFFQMFFNRRSDAKTILPSTAEVFFKEGNRRDALGSGVGGLNGDQRKVFVGALAGVLRSEELWHLLPSLERLGLLSRHADALLEPAIDGATSIERGSTAGRSAQDLVDQMAAHIHRVLPSVDLSKRLVEDYPTELALSFGQRNRVALAVELVKMCERMGPVDLVASGSGLPPMPKSFLEASAAPKEDGSSYGSLIHRWASQGHVPLVVHAIERGVPMDTPDPKTGHSLLAVAEHHGQVEMAAVIRSMVAKQAIQVLFDSGELEHPGSEGRASSP